MVSEAARTSGAGVSVVIPVYNGEAWIGRAIDSALAQGPAVAEVLVCDDGSTDGTPGLVRSFGATVSLLEADHCGNPAGPRNRGIRAAACRLIAFLDADDAWLPGKIEAQLAALRAHPGTGLVCTNAFRQADPAAADGLSSLLPSGAGRSGRVLDRLVLSNFIVTSSVLVRRNLLFAAGLFCDDEALGAEDYDLWLRVARLAPVVYLEHPWLLYRDWGASYRDEWSAAAARSGMLRILRRAERACRPLEPAERRAFRRRRTRLYADAADAAEASGDVAAARLTALRVAVREPGERDNWGRVRRVFGFAPGGRT